jgi:two-component system chemotaxis response regulator CheY
MLIDDNELTRSVLRLSMQGDRFEVVGEAAGARSGLEAVLKLRPDIVCLDVMLPDGSGLEMLPAIRDALPQCAVLMVTSSNDLATIQSALSGGACGFIVKPFNTRTVHDSLEKAVASLQRSGPAPSSD